MKLHTKFALWIFAAAVGFGINFAAPVAKAEFFSLSSERDGIYIGADLGMAIQKDIDLLGRDTDLPTQCDQLLRARSPLVETPIQPFKDSNDDGYDANKPNTFKTEGDTGYIASANYFADITATSIAEGGECARGDKWDNENSLKPGIFAGLHFGYAFGNFRAEGEYSYRNNSYDSHTDTVLPRKREELVEANQKVSISSHSAFVNFYFDFVNDSRFTPYLGAGAGFAQMNMLYDAVFTRNTDPAALPDFDEHGDSTPDAATSTSSHGRKWVDDTVFGWQVISGTDYMIDNNWSLGLKLRYQNFGEFESGGHLWDQLRSHESKNAELAEEQPTGDNYPNILNAQSVEDIRAGIPGGDGATAVDAEAIAGFDPYVRYTVSVPDTVVWSGALNLKYRFGGGSGN
ncbi:MAG: outer membrane protein [Thermodesulfobacteriota bacterium]